MSKFQDSQAIADAPEPFVSAEVDLDGYPGFILNVERLLASELIALAKPEEAYSAMMLWCRAWQQTPHGSLPNDENVLAAFSKAKNWKRVRDMALRGFVLCSDGRLYHKFLCEQVHEAWERRLAYMKKRDKDAERLREWRDKKQVGNKLGNPDETRFKASSKPLRSEVKGSEVTTYSVPNGTGAVAPPPGLSSQESIFQIAVPWLVANGGKETNVRSLLGGAVKQLGADGAWELASQCMREKPIEAMAWLAASINSRIKGGKKSNHSGFDKLDYSEGVSADGRI